MAREVEIVVIVVMEKKGATTRVPRPLILFEILGEGRGLMPGAKGRTSIEGGAQIDEIAR